MTKKKVLSLVLAIVMILSCMTVFASCKKTGDGAGVPMAKRTNVYKEEPLNVGESIGAARTMFSDGEKLIANYSSTYTVVYGEDNEEVERFDGWYYPVDDDAFDFDDGVVFEKAISSVAPIPIVGDGLPAMDGEPDEFGVIVDENQNISVPDGMYVDYATVEKFAIIPLDGGETTYAEVDFTKIVPNSEGYGYTSNIFFTSDGSVKAIYSVDSYDEETFESNSKYYVFTLDGETFDVVDQKLLNDCFSAAGIDPANTYLYNIAVADDGCVYFAVDGGEIHMADADMKFVKKIKVTDGYVGVIRAYGKDVLVSASNADYTKQTLSIISDGQVKPIELDNSVVEHMYDLVGILDGKAYFNNETGVSYADLTTGDVKEVLNFLNSDISPANLSRMLLLDDGRMIAATSDWSTPEGTMSLSILTRVPDEEIKEEIIVTVGAVYSDPDLINNILAFNKQNTGVRVNLKSYSQYNNNENEWTGAQTQLNNEIIAGTLPDVILLNISLPIQSYFQKGVFVDLNKYIDDSEKGLDRSKYLDKIFRANESNDKLFSLITSFAAESLAAKTKFVGEKQGWTFDEMVSAIKNMPEGMDAFYGAGRNDILDTFLASSMNSLVDWKTGATKFDSQAFIDFIKYLASCSEKGPWQEYYDSMEGGEYIFDADKERELEENSQLRFWKDKSLFADVYLGDFTSLVSTYRNFATKDITFVGYPTDDENANGVVVVPSSEFAISAKSKAKDQAWEFLKFVLDEGDNMWSFRTNLAALQDQKEHALDEDKNGIILYDMAVMPEEYEWMKDMGYSEDYINFMQNSNVKADEDMVNVVYDLITNATAVARYDKDLADIIAEELSGFFAGTKTAEDTARVIAGRAKTFIGERS